jgi:hypothetical protein
VWTRSSFSLNGLSFGVENTIACQDRLWTDPTQGGRDWFWNAAISRDNTTQRNFTVGSLDIGFDSTGALHVDGGAREQRSPPFVAPLALSFKQDTFVYQDRLGTMKKRKKGFKSGTLRGVFVLIASLAAFSYRSYSAMDFAQFDWEYRAGPGKKKKMVRPLFVRFIYIHRLQRIILPRQARGQHRESTQQRVLVAVFLKATRRRKTISAYE